MGQQKQTKLNRLQRHLPEELVVDAAWHERHGYSTALRSKYVAHGWLDPVARGVYRRPTAWLAAPADRESLRWQHVVISLQALLSCPSTRRGPDSARTGGIRPLPLARRSAGNPPVWHQGSAQPAHAAEAEHKLRLHKASSS